MEDPCHSMRHSPELRELSIKVPAPFAGISDLGFTTQYRAQTFNQRQQDVPLVIEGPSTPMRRLAELLRLLHGVEGSSYTWSDPVMLSDEVVVLAFRDRSLDDASVSDGAAAIDYFMNLVRPVVFPFLHDCAAVAGLRLSSVIEMRVTAQQATFAQLSLPSERIVEPNGDRLLWQQAV